MSHSSLSSLLTQTRGKQPEPETDYVPTGANEKAVQETLNDLRIFAEAECDMRLTPTGAADVVQMIESLARIADASEAKFYGVRRLFLELLVPTVGLVVICFASMVLS